MRGPSALRLLVAAVVLVGTAAGLATGRPTTSSSPLQRIPRCAAVFVGTVQSASVHRGVGLTGKARAFTHYDFGGLRVVAGSVPTSNVVVPVVGGTLDGLTLRVPDAPSFRTGERYLVFYDPFGPLCAVSGMERGAFRVETGNDGVDRVYLLDGRPAGGFRDGAVLPGESPVPLEALVGEIRGDTAEILAERRP
jgi:hypothetical protein